MFQYSTGGMIKFFKDIDNMNNNIANKKYKYKFQDLYNDYPNASPTELRVICDIMFAREVIRSYAYEETDKIELWDSLFFAIEKCLKTQPDKYQGYIKKYPVLVHFISAVISCKDNYNIKDFFKPIV